MKRVAVLLTSLALVAMLGAAFAADLGGRTITIGSDTTYPPFETVNDAGKIVGFDVDLMNAICKIEDCVAKFQTTNWDGILPAVNNGEFDMIASGMTITAERAKQVDFSKPYKSVDQAIAVRTQDSGLTLQDFTKDGSKLVLGSQTGTTNAILAEKLVGRNRMQLYNDFNQAVQALLNGDVNGVVLDDVAADAFAQQYAGKLVVDIRGVKSGDEIGFAVPQGDPKGLLPALNDGIAKLTQNGTLTQLQNKWFK
ncbi:MAG TPA: basic amino acid ABC transporter substrate-binding protein [Trueperaceae bacterium]|nr:basic amino acid ABC transporter substrate-binding protein [Trueperaceae bacterium]